MNNNCVQMKADVIDIISVKEGIVRTNHLDQWQSQAYSNNSKAIRKVNDKMYLDFSESYTATYLVYNVKGVEFKSDIRRILKKVTGKQRFSKKFLKQLVNNIPRTIDVMCDRKNKKIWLMNIENILLEAYSKM